MSLNKHFIKAIRSIVQEEVNNAHYDRTRTGTVIKVNSNNTYMVLIDNQIYHSVPIVANNYCNVGDIVKIVYPSGNISQMYIANGRQNISSVLYEVGDIYITLNNEDPSVRFGGTWEKIEGQFLLASSDSYAVGSTGGYTDAAVISHTHPQTAHTHTVGNQSASHTHSVTGGGHTHTVFAKLYQRGSGSTSTTTPQNTSSDNNRTPGTASTAHTHTVGNQSANHTHTVSGGATTTGTPAGAVSGVGRNMPPYIVVNIWKKIAN